MRMHTNELGNRPTDRRTQHRTHTIIQIFSNQQKQQKKRMLLCNVCACDYDVVHMTLIRSDKAIQSAAPNVCTLCRPEYIYSITKCTPLSFALQKIQLQLWRFGCGLTRQNDDFFRIFYTIIWLYSFNVAKIRVKKCF